MINTPSKDLQNQQRQERVNAIRFLSMDAVQAANSGHPGMPMGMADIAEVLWTEFLRHNPRDPNWMNRDRFVLSNGHGSMLVYSLLHLAGYDLPMDEIRNFRQFGSKTPGHPENTLTVGVETTTGPLGQGFANAVGMALAEKTLAAQFNRPDYELVDHHTYVFVGDGCLMEGISHEVASFAGMQQLGKLITIYDDNDVSIDGYVEEWYTDDTPQRFEAYGWQVIRSVDGHDHKAVRKAINAALDDADRPTLICCSTVIGLGSPTKQGTAAAHGAPLGASEIEMVRKTFNWQYAPFEIPDAVYETFSCQEKGARLQKQWDEVFSKYEAAHPQLAADFVRRMKGELPASWDATVQGWLQEANDNPATVASRKSSLLALNALGPVLPEIIGGSADLTGSNLTYWNDSKAITAEDASGNYIYFGVREFGMTAIVNGLALHGGFIPYAGTFLMFSEYARNAVRMAALMEIRSIFIYTHDSIGLGEDGPTHQAVEQAATLRLIPNMSVWRPCDTVETTVAWQSAIERRNGPTSLLLSRQNLTQQVRTDEQINQVKRGGYVLVEPENDPQVLIIATGSEVSIAVDAANTINTRGGSVRVVSLPCVDLFESQSRDYQDAVIPPHITKRVVVEAGVTPLWIKYSGSQGTVLGVDSFGHSAPAAEVYKHFNLTAQGVEETVDQILSA